MFEPGTLPEGGAVVLALAPAVIAGLVFFKVAAAVALLAAVLSGTALALVARHLKLGAGVSPVASAVVAVALLGPGAPVAWIAIAAVLAASLDVARRQWLGRLRFQPGLLAAAGVFLASSGLTAAYLNPGRLRPLDEPIRLWSAFFEPGAAPIDPVRLYVGNVPGPMFATSLLAVVVGAAWLWYARRLSLAVLIGFAVGAALPIAIWRWNAAYQLDSGPTWFLVALILADRATLPALRATRPLLGMAAGVAGVGLRRQGLGIEVLLLSVAALQAAIAGVEGLEWLAANRAEVARRVRGRRGAVRRLPSRHTAA